MGEFVRLEMGEGDDVGIATIRLDRPKMNALNAQLYTELHDVAVEAAQRKDVRAVVVYGGPKVFAAGADIKEMAAMGYTDMLDDAGGLSRACTAVAKIPKPVVAAVTGYALGGGCEVALSADFRVCGERTKLGTPEILLGLIPGAGGTQRLPRLVGPSKAKELVFSGRMVGAEEALAIGLVDRVVPDDDVYTAALDLVRPFASGPAYALRAAKQAIDEGLEMSLENGLALEFQLFAALFATNDRSIGMQSFIEQGPGKATFTAS